MIQKVHTFILIQYFPFLYMIQYFYTDSKHF